ncbi:hypothetical protein V6Z11_A05G275100 [Gossypium hirsutum]
MNIKTKAFFTVLVLSSCMVETKAFMLQSFTLILTKSLLLRKIISMASLLSECTKGFAAIRCSIQN